MKRNCTTGNKEKDTINIVVGKHFSIIKNKV